MQVGLSTRIAAGFLVLLVTFAGASGVAVRRMHAIREDLVLVHAGYLAMGRTATQVRTLQEAKDAYVERALLELKPDVKKQLVAYAREFYPRALRERLLELRDLADQLRRQKLKEQDERFLGLMSDQLARARGQNDAYDDVTARLLEALTAGAADAALAELVDEYRSRSGELAREIRSLSVALDSKTGEAVRRAERDEEAAAFAVIVTSIVAAAVGFLVLFMMVRALRPLRLLLEKARAIRRGDLDDVFVPMGGNDEVGALSREFNAMAQALKDREGAVAARSDELMRLTSFAENVIRSVRVGIVVLDGEGRVRTLNPAARSVFQLPLVEVDGRPLRELIVSEQRSADAAASGLLDVLDALPSVRGSGVLRMFPLRQLGTRMVEVALVPLRDRSGTSLEDVLLLGEDVTSREDTRERLLQSERLAAIGRLAAQITHEIRNPLSSVALNIELLGDDVDFLPEKRQAEARAVLHAVGKEVDRLTQITEGYLRFARLPTTKPVAKDVGDLLADLVAFTQQDAAKAGVNVELNIEPGLPAVPHDPARLRQAVLNLLRNAVEAAGHGGTVRIQARGAERGARISVEDTGPGVPADVRERLFEPFFTTKPAGTGLGLMLAREIVAEHHGALSLDSSALGGAAFHVDLPTSDAGMGAAPAGGSANPPAGRLDGPPDRP